MKFTTDFREEATGALKGSKQYYLIGHVEFSEEERAIIQQRGLYGESVEVPADTPPPTRGRDIKAGLMRVVGIILAPIGLLTYCTAEVTLGRGGTEGGVVIGMLMLIVGIALFAVGKFMDYEANKRDQNPTQQLSLRRLLQNPDFKVYAPTIDIGKVYEETARQQLAAIAQVIRNNAVVPERVTHEL